VPRRESENVHAVRAQITKKAFPNSGIEDENSGPSRAPTARIVEAALKRVIRILFPFCEGFVEVVTNWVFAYEFPLTSERHSPAEGSKLIPVREHDNVSRETELTATHWPALPSAWPEPASTCYRPSPLPDHDSPRGFRPLGPPSSSIQFRVLMARLSVSRSFLISTTVAGTTLALSSPSG
jgi:hypothetical protein